MVAIRPMTRADICAAQALLAQLGYPLSAQEIHRRYQAVIEATDHIVWVAEQDGHVVGLCHCYVRPALDKPPEVIVQALIVDQAARIGDVGKVMMAAAEEWTRDRGFTSVALASSVTRAGAHAFYEAIGYQRTATSHYFRKDLQMNI